MARMAPYWEERYKAQGHMTVGCSSFSQEQLDQKTEKVKSRMAPIFASFFAAKMVLEFGCGSGRFSDMLAPICDLHGIDIVDWAVMEARKKAPAGKFTVYDGLRIPYQDGMFGGVFSWTVLQHIPPEEIGGIASEIVRVMEKGARLLIYENVTSGDSGNHVWFRSALNYVRLFETLQWHGYRLVQRADDTDEAHALMWFIKEHD